VDAETQKSAITFASYLIKKYEGFSLVPYLCPRGLPTIGFGCRYYPNGALVSLKDQAITAEMAEFMLNKKLDELFRELLVIVPKTMKSTQYGALLSLCYNIGIDSFDKSSLCGFILEGPKDKVIDGFQMWNKITDQKTGVKYCSLGLAKRRFEEMLLFMNRIDIKVT
jgi:lysozyme